MRFIKVLLLLVLFVFGLLFFVQNSAVLGSELKLQFDLYYNDLKWTSDGVPFYFVILAAFAVGMLFATCCLLIDRIRLGCALMSQKRALRNLENALARQGGAQSKDAVVLDATGSQVKELPQKGAAAPEKQPA